MPELPEVESVCRGLRQARLVAPLQQVWRSELALRIGKEWQHENLEALPRGAIGQAVARRGKYIVWSFGDRSLLIHLGMSGRVLVGTYDEPVLAHTHLRLRFADDREVRFVDPRRFGGLKVDDTQKLWEQPPLSRLGPEPLELQTGAALHERGGRSKRALRDVLLDQRVVAGVGNIYAVEALFEARLHPLLPAARLRASAWDRLAAAIKRVLARSIDNGGTTFRDYRNAEGREGSNQFALAVYGRAGEACLVCGASLVGFVHQARSGVYCPSCQARSRARWVR